MTYVPDPDLHAATRDRYATESRINLWAASSAE